MASPTSREGSIDRLCGSRLVFLHRFQHSKVVSGEMGVRFYMGAPLVASNGHRVGML